VNLDRKKARIVKENISMEDWEKHFLELLEGEKGTGEETGEKRRMGGSKEGAGIERNGSSIKEDKKIERG